MSSSGGIVKIAMLPGGQTKCLFGIAHWNGILFLAPFAHLSLGTSAWQWSAWAIHSWRKLICPYFTRIFSLLIQFCLKPLSPKLRGSHIAVSVPCLFQHLLDFASRLKACGHYYSDTKALPCLRRADLTPADCRCNCTIIRAASCQVKLSFHYRFYL